MIPSRVQSVLTTLLDARWAVFLWGPPGAGKSSVVRQVAAQLNVPLLDVRAALLDPTDIRGIPAVIDGRAVWCPPSFLPQEEQKAGILFLDELSAAPPLVQASLYQLILDRRVGEYELPAGWRIVAAGNRAADRSVSFRMPAALANRFVHLDFEVDSGDWHLWAVQNGVDPLIIGFLAFRRQLLFDMSNPERGFPTPRSWEIVSDTVRALGSVHAARDVIPGIVGEAAAIEFLAYCADTITEERVQSIIADPDGATLPTSLGDLYALVAYLVSSASRSAPTRKAAGRLLNRLSPELSVLLARDLLRVHPAFALDAGYLAFVAQHADLLM